MLFQYLGKKKFKSYYWEKSRPIQNISYKAAFIKKIILTEIYKNVFHNKVLGPKIYEHYLQDDAIFSLDINGKKWRKYIFLQLDNCS